MRFEQLTLQTPVEAQLELLESDCTPFTANGVHFSYTELLDRFDYSKYGLAMRDQDLRFSQHFGYDRYRMLRDLGPDVDPIRHNWMTFAHVHTIIKTELTDGDPSLISEEDMGIALFAAGLHDTGEAMHPSLVKKAGGVVGDIPYGEKTDADRAIEAAVRQVSYGEFYYDVPAPVIARTEAVISHADDSMAHTLFESGHALTTFFTGLNAARAVFEIRRTNPSLVAHEREEQEIAKLTALARVVPRLMHQELQKYTELLHVRRVLEDKNGAYRNVERYIAA